MKVIDAFAGLGGFSLAADALGWDTVAFVEWDKDCQFWLGEHWPNVPIYGDITTVRWEDAPPCDIFTAGFPCQPHSVAGKREASADDRDLWSECVRAISTLRPRYAVLENVPGLLTSESGRFFNRVISDLAKIGYVGRYDVLSAAECGAPHRRERVWIVAYPRYDERTGRCEPTRGGVGESRAESAPRGASLDQLAESDVRGRDDRQPHVLADHGGEPALGDTPPCGGVLDSTARGGRDVADAESERIDGRAEQAGRCRSDRHRHELGDPTRGGRGTREGLDVRRAVGGCHGVGNATVERCEGLRAGGEQELRAYAGSGLPVRGGAKLRRQLARAWADAIPYRGADGSVRLIPRAALELGDTRSGRRGGIDGRRSGEVAADGHGELSGREAEGTGAEPEIRALADGLPNGLAGRHAAEEVEAWPTVDSRSHHAQGSEHNPLAQSTQIALTAAQFGGTGGSLWPVTESEPGRVARLKAVGNSVSPAWCLAGPFRFILDREGLRDGSPDID